MSLESNAKMRNAKCEARNKFEIRMLQCYSTKALSDRADWLGGSDGLEHWEIERFGFVSDFDIRI